MLWRVKLLSIDRRLLATFQRFKSF